MIVLVDRYAAIRNRVPIAIVVCVPVHVFQAVAMAVRVTVFVVRMAVPMPVALVALARFPPRAVRDPEAEAYQCDRGNERHEMRVPRRERGARDPQQAAEDQGRGDVPQPRQRRRPRRPSDQPCCRPSTTIGAQ